jgi:hypothetical protein
MHSNFSNFSSALVLLHERTWTLAQNFPSQEGRKESAFMALSSAIRMVIDISRRFHMDLAFIDLPALPLPATYSVYRTTLLYIQLSGDEFRSPEWSSNMESTDLKTSMILLMIPEHYLNLIDIAMSDEIEARSRMKMDISRS